MVPGYSARNRQIFSVTQELIFKSQDQETDISKAYLLGNLLHQTPTAPAIVNVNTALKQIFSFLFTGILNDINFLLLKNHHVF
jgi:hypothetical protein